jgi:transcriptional regulator with XRE-family HTH domain
MPETGNIPQWTLGWRMQRSLAHADITVSEIARDLGVSRATISRWLNDRGAPPRAIYVKEWALRCGVSCEWLRADEELPVPTRTGGISSRRTLTLLVSA